jgi:hypothetical protein
MPSLTLVFTLSAVFGLPNSRELENNLGPISSKSLVNLHSGCSACGHPSASGDSPTSRIAVESLLGFHAIAFGAISVICYISSAAFSASRNAKAEASNLKIITF